MDIDPDLDPELLPEPFATAEPLRLRLDRPEELLAYLPYRFGFTPSESLALLAVLEPVPGEIVLGLAARLDIADLERPRAMREAMQMLAAQLLQDPTAWVVTVLYTQTPVAHVRARWGVAGRVLSRWLAEFPYAEPAATFVVGPETFCCLDCPQCGCCPLGGHSVERLRETAVAARMVLDGEVIAASRDELACPRSTDPVRSAAAARAADRERRGMQRRPPEHRDRWRERMLDRYGAALTGVRVGSGRWTPAADDLGRLGAALSDPHLRDAVVAWTVGGERFRSGSTEVLDRFGGVLAGGLAPPGQAHLDAAEVVLIEVARHAPPGRGGYPLAVLGWLAWWRGDGARAGVVCQQALDESPGNSLGRLLADALDAGVRPGWARPDPTVVPEVR